jgi:hypothetical protein
MEGTTRERAEDLKARAARFIQAVSSSMENIHKTNYFDNSSDYAKMKNRDYYYASVEAM